MEEVSSIVKQDGVATFVTDDEGAKDRMLEATFLSKKWMPKFKAPYYITEKEDYGNSYFDSLWRKKDREIKYLQFINSSSSI
jgi:tRNA (guanine-N7-)-methyltransferase